MYRIEIVFTGANVFPIAFERVSSPRDDTMDMWVQRQVLPPSVQHANSTAFNTIMCICKAMECPPNCRKQQIVIHALVEQANRIQYMWYCENNMIMLYRKCFVSQFFNPYGLLGRQTFRAVTVATTVVAIANLVTAITTLFVPAKCQSTALQNVEQYFYFLCRWTVFFDICRSKPSDNIGYF